MTVLCSELFCDHQYYEEEKVGQFRRSWNAIQNFVKLMSSDGETSPGVLHRLWSYQQKKAVDLLERIQRRPQN